MKYLLFLLLLPFAAIAQPIARAGGNYIYNEDPHGVNIFYPINASASTGSNLKYHWQVLALGFYPNNSATPSTNTGIESTWAVVKQSTFDTAIVTQLYLNTDSTRKIGVQLKVTDSVSGLFSIDTCYIIFRARKDYPPQSIDGGTGFHLWGTNATYDNLHVPHGKTHDLVFTGAQDDAIHNAAGSNVNMSIFIGTGSSITIDHTVKPTIWIAGGHYRTISMLGDTIGGSGWQFSGQDTAHAFTISYYDTCVVTDFGFHLSNPRFGRLTGIYDAVNGYGRSDFPGAQNGYAYTQHKYGFQFTGLNQYIGGAAASIDGVSTQWFEIDHVEICDGHADGMTIKQDEISGHSNYTWSHIKFHDNYIHNIFQEGKYGGSSVNGQQATDSSESYNNRATFCGDKGMKDVSIGTGNFIHNNAVFACGLNALSPFEANVTFPRELGFFNQGNIIYRELIAALGGTDQVLNVIAQDPPNAIRVIGENKISNEVIIEGHGYTQVYVGGPFDNTSPTFTFHLDSCYFGLAGVFTGNQVYTTGQPSSNTTWQSNAQPGGSSSLLDTINFTHNTYDSTKFTLFNGNAVTTTTGNTLIKAVHFPHYVNTGFIPGSMIRFYCDTIYGTYLNEFPETGTKQGQLFAFSAGDTCWYMGLTYISLQNNNVGHMPQDRTDNWWRLVTYANGRLYPPDDIRLFTSDPFAKLNIGLLDQVPDFISIPAGSKIITH